MYISSEMRAGTRSKQGFVAIKGLHPLAQPKLYCVDSILRICHYEFNTCLLFTISDEDNAYQTQEGLLDAISVCSYYYLVMN